MEQDRSLHEQRCVEPEEVLRKGDGSSTLLAARPGRLESRRGNFAGRAW
jgi:hypothetical protein